MEYSSKIGYISMDVMLILGFNETISLDYGKQCVLEMTIFAGGGVIMS